VRFGISLGVLTAIGACSTYSGALVNNGPLDAGSNDASSMSDSATLDATGPNLVDSGALVDGNDANDGGLPERLVMMLDLASSPDGLSCEPGGSNVTFVKGQGIRIDTSSAPLDPGVRCRLGNGRFKNPRVEVDFAFAEVTDLSGDSARLPSVGIRTQVGIVGGRGPLAGVDATELRAYFRSKPPDPNGTVRPGTEVIVDYNSEGSNAADDASQSNLGERVTTPFTLSYQIIPEGGRLRVSAAGLDLTQATNMKNLDSLETNSIQPEIGVSNFSGTRVVTLKAVRVFVR
jgi:hypothetical protein